MTDSGDLDLRYIMTTDALRVFEDLPVEAFRRVVDASYLQQGLTYFKTHAVKNLNWSLTTLTGNKLLYRSRFRGKTSIKQWDESLTHGAR